ncbi:MAG: polysaccharide biosynthesis tyrosine autokinase, partial [Muribaculum sp.]|nr:polysaccharide biosynthesis tyrosine autokinase [Muribaculum sp.]
VVERTPYCPDSVTAELEVSKMPMAAAAGSYRGRLGVALGSEEGSVINLSISDQSIQRGKDVLGMLIAVYNENWIHDKNQIAVSTSNFINDRLGVIERELGNVDSDISSYKSEHLIPDVKIASSLYLNQSQQTSQELLALNNQLQMTRYIRNWLTSESSKNQVLPTNSGVENVNIQSQLAEYNDKILQRNNLISKSSEKNPLVIAIDEQIAALRGAIIQSVDNSIIALNTQIKSLQSDHAATTSKIASNPSQAKYLLSVERQQKVKESLYLFLLQKREENELNQAFTAYNTRIVENPSSSGAPTYPNRRNVLMMSFLIGLAIPFGFIYIKETSNTKLRGRKDVSDLVTPFLGEIPQYGKTDDSDQKQKQFVVRSGSRNIINESFRVLRTNVEFMRINRDRANVIAITSFNPGSGKSFLTMNLAASLAIKNRKVLVIDGDMRHGSSSQYVNSPGHGLADYLAGTIDDIHSVIVSVEDIPNLHVLPIGVIPPNPTELLETPQFASMIESLRGSYEYILIDCPPIEVVADAQIIDNLVDRTIFVLRAGMLERSMLPELDRLYNEKKYRNMAFILNGTRNDQGRYGYSHSYRYGYGYGYGYGYNYGNDKKKSDKKKK